MSTINKKEFGWVKSHLTSELVAGIICGFIGLFSLARGDAVPFIFLLLSVFAFINFFSKRKTSYIQITNDGIHVSSEFFNFMRRAKDIKWKNISKIEKIGRNKRSVPYKMTLSLLSAKNITINLGFLNKDDRNSLIQIIKETIENKTTA